MKKIVLLSLIALALCVFPTNMRAENVCHAIGEATTTGDMPKSGSHSSTFQMIFTKEELLAAGVQPGYIGSIKFNWLGTNNTSKKLYIYMASTAKSVFANGDDYEPAATFTTARGYYYEDIFWSTINGEKTYTFNSPFVWDGYSNIVIATIVNGDAGDSYDINFTARGSDCGANRCIWDSGSRNTDEFSVGSFGFGHCSTFRPVISFCQDNTPCSVVTNLTASDVLYTSATISWDACASCTNGFDVVCSKSQITDFSTVTPQHITTNSIDLTGLDEYTDYYVYVRSCCGTYSAWSEALHFKTFLDCSAPEDVTVSDVRKYSMTLSWTPKALVSSYDIILSTTALTDPSSAQITCNVTGGSKEFGNLQRNTTYYFYVRANCGMNGYSDWIPVSATTLPLGYDCGRTADYVFGTGSYASYGLVHLYRLCNYTQMIYTADELYGLGFTAGPIKAVEFNFESNAAQYQKEQSVYIGTTSKDKFTEENVSEFVPGLTLVYGPERRDFPTAGGWLRYNFNAPFYWDGVSNIVIGFLSNRCNGDTETGGWQAYYTACDSSVIFSVDDNFLNVNNIQNSYLQWARPNIKFATCPDNNPCPPLTTAPVASNITHDAATITWNAGSEGNASSYDMIVSENSISYFTNVTPTYSGITTTSRNLTGLDPNTQYFVYIRVNCTNGDESDGSSLWSPAGQFRTLNNVAGIASFAITDETMVVGSVNLDAEHHQISAVVKEETDLTTIPFTFTLADNTCSIAKVDGSSFQSPCDFTNPVTVRVYAEDITVYEDWEITIIEEPCPAPKNFAVGQITSSNSAQLSWTQNGSIRTWRIYGAQGNAIEVNSSNCTVNGNQYSYTLTGLTPNADYTLQLQGICGEDESSSLYAAEQPQFHTLNNAIGITSFEMTNATVVGNVNIDAANHTIKAVVAEGTSLDNIQFELTLADGCTAKVGDAEFTSPQDFTYPVAIQLYAEDSNISPQEWTIIIANETCTTPYNLGVVNIAGRNATLNWSIKDNTATSFDLVVSKEQLADPSTGTVQDINFTDNAYMRSASLSSLSSLKPDTHYYIYIRTDCGTETSRWSSVEFNTLPVYNCFNTNTFVVAQGETGATPAAFPVNSNSFNTSQKSQSIYPASMLPDDWVGKKIMINRLKYFVGSGGFTSSNGTPSFNIKMMNTTESTFSDGFVSTASATLVGNDRPLSVNSNVMEIELSTPFVYTGENILIEFELTRTCRKPDNQCKFFGVWTENNVSYYNNSGFSSALNFLPKVEFSTCEEVVVCPALTSAPVESEVKHNSATITWNEGTGEHLSSYDMIVSETAITDFTGATPAHQGITGTSYNLTSLKPNTQYYVYVRANCTATGYDDGSSLWSPECQFRTLNNVTGIASFSLNDDVVAGDVTIDETTHTISVATRYGTDLSNLAFTLTLADVNGIAKYNEENLPQSLNFTDPVAIRVYAEDRSIYQDWVITVTEENCKEPYNISVSTISARTATLNWNLDDNTQTSFQLVLSKVQLNPSDVTPTIITVTNDDGVWKHTLTPLTPGTHYYAYIRTNCGNKSSHWSFVEFNTMSVLDCNNTDAIVVADGTSSGLFDRCKFPIMGIYCDRTQKTQSIYPASMLTDLMGNRISKLKYFVEQLNYGGLGNIEFNIKMKSTDQSTLSDFIATTDATLVYSGPLTPNNQNMEIALTKSFDYTGGNLLIEFELTETGNQTYCYFRGIQADGNVSRFQMWEGNYSWSPESSTFLPQVEFTTCEKVVACPALSAAPVASGVTSNAATITWNAGTGDHVSTYDIIVSNEEINDFTNITTDNTSETSYNLTSLSPETQYYVYVRVNCNADGYDDGSSLWSPACVFITDPVCTAPENFAAEAQSSTTARLTWTKRGGAESWRIHVAPDNRTVDVNSDNDDCQIDGSKVSYTLTGLSPKTQYTLQLQSIYGDECSADLYADEQPSFRTLNDETGIASFSLDGDVVVGDVTIDDARHTISVTTRYGTDLSNIAFSLTLADVNGIAKYNEENLPQSLNFTDPVAIQVYAEDRNISQEWTISIVNETCATPYNLRVTNIAGRTAKLNWNVKDNTATSFDIVVSKESLDPSTIASWQNITVTNDDGVWKHTLTPLTPVTHYYVYIRTDCGNETSHWSSVEFNTMLVLDCNSTDAIVVAEGTVENDQFPVYGYQCDHSQKTQSIYPASMLTGLFGNKITRLKYFVKSGGSSSSNRNWENATFKIRMMTTNETNLSSGFVSTADATEVYSGTLRANVQNGMEITLDEHFDYTGGNLLIEFELPVKSDFSSCSFYGIEADGNVSCFQYVVWNHESSDFLPKVEFTTCEKVVVCPEVTNVAATNVDETSATISWTESEGTYANTSDIYYSTTRVTDFTGIEPQVTGITGTSRQITGLAPYTTYYVYVRTHCDKDGYDDGISGWTDTSFLTLASCRIPGSLTPTVTDKHTATVAWTNTSGGSQDDNFTYILSTTPIAEDALKTTATTATGVTTTSVDLTNLQSETTYYFYLKNVCTGDVNCSSPWVSCQFTMPAEMPAVINLQAHDIAHNAFTATWESDIDNFADETEWEVACVAHGTQPTTWTQVSVPEYFALGLTAETTYDFYVRAMSGDSHSADTMIEVTTIRKSAVVDCKDVIIGENALICVPVYSNFMGSYTVQIYTADDLRAIGYNSAGNIEKIAFYQTNCSNTSEASRYRKSTTVWMGNTTKESFADDNDWITGLTKVMDEKPVDFNKNGDWVELQFDESFYWDGTSNLAIAVLAYSDSYTTMNFAGGYVGPNRSIYSYADEASWTVTDGVPSHTDSYNSSELANIKFCFETDSCRSVDKLKVDNITNNTARAHWYPGDAETTWHVYNSTTEMTDDALDALTSSDYSEVTDNPEYNISGLNPNNDYYIYVRAVCGGNDGESKWRKYRYATSLLCSAPTEAVAYSQTDNAITFTATAGEVGTAGSYDYRYWMVGSEGSAVTVSNEQSPFTVTGLTAGDTYEWEVRANCSGNEGSSRWVRGNAVKVCGTANLPFFSHFDQCDEGSVPDCWSVLGNVDDENYVTIEEGWSKNVLVVYGTSSVATPRLNFPAGDYDITMNLYTDYRGQMKVMFATDLSDETTYTTIHTIDMNLYEYFNATLPLHIDAVTTGYIVLSQTGSSYLSSGLYSLNVVESAVVDDGCSEFVAGYEGYFKYAPVYSNYDASYTIQIYTADELIDQGCQAGDISSIAFYQTECDGSVEDEYKKYTTVWMGNTTKESFANDNDWITGLTKVMDEKPVDFNKNGDWVDLPLDNGKTFYWDGESNLAVAVLAYSDEFCDMYFRCGKAGDEYRTIVTYQDNYEPTGGSGVPSMRNQGYSSYRANIKLCYAPGICPTVTGITVDDITATSATARWTAGENVSTWHVYNSPTKLTNAELAALDQTQQYTVVNTNPESSLNNLIKDTDYYLYVRAACSADEVSYWRYYKYSTLPTCSAPAEAIATSESDNSITFTVNHGEYGDEGTYDYRYWIAGSNDIVTESGKTSPFTVSGLSGDKDYEWEVRANCSGTDEGSSRWVKGNTIHVCGVLTLPYFNDFEQYEDYDMLECWKVMESYTFPYYPITYPCIELTYFYDYDREFDTKALAISNNSSIATPLINVPAEGLRISLDYIGDEEGNINVMFTTNLTADESTYTPIGTLDNPSYDELTNLTLQFTPGQATAGYIVFSYMSHVDPGVPVLYIEYLDNLLIEAMPTSDTKDVTVDNVTYTISGLLQGNNVTIEEVSFNEDDLTEADFDITYNNTFLNYKHKLDIPETLTDVIKDRYKVVGINAAAFNDVDLTENVRVNVPADVNLTGTLGNGKIVMKLDDGGIHYIHYNGNSYSASKAYKVNLCDGATLEQRPFGEQTLIISCPDDEEGTDEDGVVTTQTGARLDFEDGWTETLASTSNELEASLDEDEVTIDVNRLSKICIADTAKNVVLDNFVDKYCEEVMFRADLVGRNYPECSAVTNITLDRSAEVKAEFALDNKEYYYFSLPFDCKLEDIKVMAGTDVVERSNSIDEAVYSTDHDAHHYVLFEWDESAYTIDTTNGYVAFSGTRLEKNKGYVIAIVESAGWYDTYWNVDGASLAVTATFTASNCTEIASSDSEIEIPVTRADAANAYSGWNLVGNPFYGSVLSSQYDTHSENKYVRKVVFDRGDTAYVADYAPNIPDFNAEIKPFETVFIQKSDAAGEGTVTVSGTSPVQQVQGAPAILPEYVTITLNDSSRMIDRTTIINDVLSSDDFLQEEDLLKSHQSSNEIYTQYGDFDFSFNEMNIIDADKTIPLAVKVAAEGDYTIAMSSELSNYPVGYVFLHDKTLETYMKVSDGEVETLHLTEGVTEGRLELVIKVDEVIVEPDNTEDVSEGGIAVYVHHGIATIEGIEVGAMVTIVDATGKTLYMSEATDNRMDYQFTVRGVYMITVRNNAGVNTVKVVY